MIRCDATDIGPFRLLVHPEGAGSGFQALELRQFLAEATALQLWRTSACTQQE